MNYEEIVDAALSYADRSDTGTVSRIGTFLRIVESRVNTVLTVQSMTATESITLQENVVDYGLPASYKALVDIKYTGPSINKSLTLLTPEEIAAAKDDPTNNSVYGYAIIGGTLTLAFIPSADDIIDNNLSIIFFKRLPGLTSVTTTNWLSELNPECYIFGLCVEIFSFVKDADAAMLWEQRFNDSLAKIADNDYLHHWSGQSITTRVA